MTVSLASLQKLMTLKLSTEQMEGVIDVLTAELAPLESSRERAAARQLRFRQRNDGVGVTLHAQRDDNVSVTSLAPVEDNITKPSLIVKEVSKNLPPSPSKPLSSDPEGFAELWAIYPKRAGSVDRKTAVKAYGPALKRVDLKTLLAGARKYAAFCQSTGKVGTESVKQLRTWLNADGWTETYEGKTNDDFASTRDFLQRIGRA